MNISFGREETGAAGVWGIARVQRQDAIAEIQGPSLHRYATVYQKRRRYRKLRGLSRRVRPCLTEGKKSENARGGELKLSRTAGDPDQELTDG